MIPISKSLEKYDHEAKGNRVRKTIHGPSLILSVFPSGEPMDIKEAIEETRKVNSCKELKNIDIEYFYQSFGVVSYPKILIHADCEK
jgi:hypothetical protein